jgi:hypothetical protein
MSFFVFKGHCCCGVDSACQVLSKNMHCDLMDKGPCPLGRCTTGAPCVTFHTQETCPSYCSWKGDGKLPMNTCHPQRPSLPTFQPPQIQHPTVGNAGKACPGDKKFGKHGWKSCSDCCKAGNPTSFCGAYCLGKVGMCDGSAGCKADPPPGPTPTCTDRAPDTKATCAQQKAWGKCGESWMQGHCCKTCFGCNKQCRSQELNYLEAKYAESNITNVLV